FGDEIPGDLDITMWTDRHRLLIRLLGQKLYARHLVDRAIAEIRDCRVDNIIRNDLVLQRRRHPVRRKQTMRSENSRHMRSGDVIAANNGIHQSPETDASRKN